MSEEYQHTTRATIALLDESLISYDLMECLLKYIKSLNIGNVLFIFRVISKNNISIILRGSGRQMKIKLKFF